MNADSALSQTIVSELGKVELMKKYFASFFLGLSNATFRTDSRVLHYSSVGQIRHSLVNITLSFRTRQTSATLLHAQKGSDYLTVSLMNSYLVMELQVEADKVTVQSLAPLSDRDWHFVEISMKNQTVSSRWTLAVDKGKEVSSMAKTAVEVLDFLKEGANIFLGGLNLDSGVSLSGCLGPVKIGGLLLPFYPETELNFPRPQEEQFVRRNPNAAAQYGCWGKSVCAPNPCHNGGLCEDLFDLHECECPPEWTGPVCQNLTDSCNSSPCVFGNCTSLDGRFKCECELGFTGERCEVEVDMCEVNSCSHGATCLRGFQRYTCLCPRDMTGQYCE